MSTCVRPNHVNFFATVFNANFELLHISILREYLGLEFEVRDVSEEFNPNSKFELEPTIDDFVRT